VDGVAAPYSGWAQQLLNAGGCAPTVAQALVPFPQFCDSLFGLNENLGSSTYHSFQTKLEKRYSSGLYALVSYTFSKLISSSAGSTQAGASTWSGAVGGGVISPYEWSRNKVLSPDDSPHTFTAAVVYELPIGRGKRWLNSGGLGNRLFSGWELTGTFKFASGTPLYFRSGSCNVPGQFRVACIPSLNGSPFLQSKDNFDPNKPLFNVNAFEPATDFNYFYGAGSPVTNYRGFPYKNMDIGIGKKTAITERVSFLIRAEAYNAMNLHNFVCGSQTINGCVPFNNDISSPSFGQWNGSVSQPRNIQLVGRIEF
jgi:hypothetical protein